MGRSTADSPVTHVREMPARAGVTVPWPEWTGPELRSALTASGVRLPWSHQVEMAELGWSGRHAVIATGTASGKSLGYQLPVLGALQADPRATALYLSPTKALGVDQLTTIGELGIEGIRAAAFTGDTPMVERDWVKAHSRWIFTNPDMLHRNLLPNHERWSHFFRRLRYVVIDECHTYRGLFGSHVALLLRRLRRVTARYRAEPIFLLASATVSDPAVSATRLTGVDCVAVTEDNSPRGSRTVALWEPPLLEDLTGENGAPVRRSAGAEAAGLLADLVAQGTRTLAFVRSRQGAELTAMQAGHQLSFVAPELVDRVAAYRGGYLPEDRRRLEAALNSGELLGVAATNALELGVDVSGLDAVLVAGFPGTLASFWQQAGRAGRAGEHALIVLIARDDPLDTYLVHHPKAVFDRPVEATVFDPGNPYVLAPQLACAAAELPITPDDLTLLGGDDARPVVDRLVADNVLRKRPRGWYWTQGSSPHGMVDIRGGDGVQVAVVEGDTGRLLGSVDGESAPAHVHPGAVYLHQGESFVVDHLDLQEGLALVHRENPEWNTMARSSTEVVVREVLKHRRYGDAVSVALGEVEVTSQVVGYLRRLPNGVVLDQVPLDMPARTLITRSVWYTLSDELLYGNAPGGAGLDPARAPGALHAAEHAAIGLLPLFATCDRWDIGGLSTVLHGDTGEASVFVHDGHPGGAGFADRGYSALVPWLAATRETIASCECPAGCPSCVQSPKCGNGNEPLDKAGSVVVLDTVLGIVRGDGAE
ncbi:DEAD/DEAH box helicase [Pseudonocardiaceae bacterium YIM PH 21723]|nr:DEAD/DEAH box helicase [Pseudonocardiaceae bacterium YIM PH 21723]